jgi:hypothetical protein
MQWRRILIGSLGFGLLLFWFLTFYDASHMVDVVEHPSISGPLLEILMLASLVSSLVILAGLTIGRNFLRPTIVYGVSVVSVLIGMCFLNPWGLEDPTLIVPALLTSLLLSGAWWCVLRAGWPAYFTFTSEIPSFPKKVRCEG